METDNRLTDKFLYSIGALNKLFHMNKTERKLTQFWPKNHLLVHV